MIGSILRYRYELLEKTGDGFLFSVFRARDRVQNRVVTIKLVREPFYQNYDLVDALRNAAFTTARLSNPSAARVYEVDEHDGIPFLITEYARGANLKERIRRVAPLSVPVAIDTAIGIAEALDAAHRAGIVHADLCPQNIIVGMEGNVKVTDFGLSPVFTASAEVQSLYLGRAAYYLPPEVSQGAPPSVTTDVYSLGVILYEMLTGDLPFIGETPFAVALQHSQRALPSLRVMNPAVPTTVDEMVMKAMQKEPEQRYQTAAAMLYDLKTVRDALRFGKPLTWSPLNAGERPGVSGPVPTATAPPIVTPPEKIVPKAEPPALKPEPIETAVAAPLVMDEPVEREPVVSVVEKKVKEEPSPAAVPQKEAEPIIAAPAKQKMEERPVIAAPKPPPAASAQEVVYEDSGIPFWFKLVWGLLLLTVIAGIFIGAGFLFFNWTAPREVAVPMIIGKSRQEAQNLLEAKGLRLQVSKSDYSEKFPPDTIYLTIPEANKPIKTGDTVQVWMSLGSKYVRMPDVSRMPEEEARKTLEAVSLSYTTKSKSSESVVFGDVLGQKPRAGTKIERGSIVELTISSGPSSDSSASSDNEPEKSKRTFKININLPPGTGDVALRIEVDDDNGTAIAWEGKRPPGSRFSVPIEGTGDTVKARLYADDILVKEFVFKTRTE